MAASSQFLEAIRKKNFLEAKEQFSALMQDKMRALLAREYQDAAKTIGVRESATSSTSNKQ